MKVSTIPIEEGSRAFIFYYPNPVLSKNQIAHHVSISFTATKSIVKFISSHSLVPLPSTCPEIINQRQNAAWIIPSSDTTLELELFSEKGYYTDILKTKAVPKKYTKKIKSTERPADSCCVTGSSCLADIHPFGQCSYSQHCELSLWVSILIHRRPAATGYAALWPQAALTVKVGAPWR